MSAKRIQKRGKSPGICQKGLVQKREAFVIDTYAEALFINNDIRTAVSAAKEALSISKDKKEYYKNQLQRFEELLNP